MKLIVAVDERWGIGRDNGLLFAVPEDMTFFKVTTMGKVVVMGRRTLESLPNAAPLKNRINIVLTKDASKKIDGVVICNTIEQLRDAVSGYDSGDVFVIGGHSVYEQLLDYCDEAFVTKIYANGGADRFFPDLDSDENWILTETSETKTHNGLEYNFCRYRNETVLPFPI